jgi:hypothetical protein
MKDLKPIPAASLGAPEALRVRGPIGLVPGRPNAPAAPVRPAPGWRLPSGQLLVEYALRAGFASSPLLVRLPLTGSDVEPGGAAAAGSASRLMQRSGRSLDSPSAPRVGGRKRKKPATGGND